MLCGDTCATGFVPLIVDRGEASIADVHHHNRLHPILQHKERDTPKWRVVTQWGAHEKCKTAKMHKQAVGEKHFCRSTRVVLISGPFWCHPIAQNFWDLASHSGWRALEGSWAPLTLPFNNSPQSICKDPCTFQGFNFMDVHNTRQTSASQACKMVSVNGGERGGMRRFYMPIWNSLGSPFHVPTHKINLHACLGKNLG